MRSLDPPDQLYSPIRLRLPWLLLMAVLACGSALARTQPSGPGLPHFDKVVHFFVFGLLGTLLFRSLRFPLASWKRWAWAMAGVALFGALDEVLQYFNPTRSFDPLDWIADVSGGLVAILCYRNWPAYRAVLEYPLWGRLAKAENLASNRAS